eukprot:jgi/Ulvmu1/3637/UM017_0050.1
MRCNRCGKTWVTHSLPPAPRAPRRSQLACIVQASAASPLSTTAYESLSINQKNQIGTFVDFLLEENAKYNLTAIRDRDEAITRHVLDSLALLEVIEGNVTADSAQNLSLIDIGSGPGLPGCILAIARPAWTVTCMDSMQKRVTFIQSAASRAGMVNVVPVCGRAEDLGRAEAHREAYTVAVARAVADTAILAEYCLPFVAEGGLWVAAKGPDIEEEVDRGVAAVRQLGGGPPSVVPVASHSEEGQRTALVVAKVARTPDRFPRRSGVPRKRPLVA